MLSVSPSIAPEIDVADNLTDNTNADPDTRGHWIQLARKVGVPIRCIYFTAPTKLCQHNDTVRALNEGTWNPEKRQILPHSAFSAYAARFNEPKLKEGFQDITTVPFQVRRGLSPFAHHLALSSYLYHLAVSWRRRKEENLEHVLDLVPVRSAEFCSASSAQMSIFFAEAHRLESMHEWGTYPASAAPTNRGATESHLRCQLSDSRPT